MKLLGIFLMIFGNSAFAATTNGYDLKMDLSLNGKHISSPRVIVKASETATITQKTDTEETFIEVIAAEGEIQNHKGILMKFTVGTINKDGKRTIISKPQILAKENEKSQITVGESGSSENLSLSVLAKRRAL
jgi:type II secretory pathway component GspD/PulD (secretin)